ncbi:potassium-transporting ATPase subunit KdpC [Streptomyces sp. NBC_00335]|uniref:potassium-transporting ATPase subunit KdpC n=1 Tax=unclassified Streptomyces TaxID=2593676 RepID=UPI0022509575|nr:MULTISPECIES: potassium-transporting ATPase subunit KdpC [unclassified Streptomyces]MCX5405829.1 potassium-transporting ATPase subunit KdpC [Streptomyces sp. NBC_00086]
MNNSVGNTARLLGAGLRALLVLTVLCGVLYPLAVTGIAQAAFGHKANGSEVEDASGKVVGSSLIGQSYGDDPRWFQGRPAAGLAKNTVNQQYELLVSGATNKAADSPELLRAVQEARSRVLLDNTVPGYAPRLSDIPADAVTSSGSGLDPDISPAYAELQTARVAQRNGLPVMEVAKLVKAHTEGRTLGFMGEPRVNVLELNTALRDLKP